MEKYFSEKDIQKAVSSFWNIRKAQSLTSKDPTGHGAVLGGKQLDGFITLLSVIAQRMGIPKEYIHTKGNVLPGFYRPSKDWDFLILSPKGEVLVVIELKSQKGSYGNNYNNRVEEALGSSLDFWTLCRDEKIPFTSAPWLGYLFVIGKEISLDKPTRNAKSLFPILPEFINTSYLQRYEIFARKMIREKNYNSVGLIWTTDKKEYGDLSTSTSLGSFLFSYIGKLYGHLHEYK